MQPAQHDSQELLGRVAALEERLARHRRWTAILALLCLPLLAGVACGDSDESGTTGATNASFFELDVNRLLLRDRNDQVAARLETNPETGVMLTLYGAPDVPAMEFHAGVQFSNIRMYTDGTQRFEVVTDSAASTARLSLLNMEQRPILQAAHESGLTSFYLLGDPNERGLRSNIGFTMQPGAYPPILSTRNQQLETKVWGLGN